MARFSLSNYIKSAYAELRQVTWPTRQVAWQSTVTVIFFSVLVAVLLGAIDWAFAYGFNYLITYTV